MYNCAQFKQNIFLLGFFSFLFLDKVSYGNLGMPQTYGPSASAQACWDYGHVPKHHTYTLTFTDTLIIHISVVQHDIFSLYLTLEWSDQGNCLSWSS